MIRDRVRVRVMNCTVVNSDVNRMLIDVSIMGPNEGSYNYISRPFLERLEPSQGPHEVVKTCMCVWLHLFRCLTWFFKTPWVTCFS